MDRERLKPLDRGELEALDRRVLDRGRFSLPDIEILKGLHRGKLGSSDRGRLRPWTTGDSDLLHEIQVKAGCLQKRG